MKYICTEQLDGTQEMFTFPDSVDHDAMAEVLNRIKDKTTGNWKRITRQPISAGFIGGLLTCYGKSETLNLSSRKIEDTELLRSQ